MTYNREGPILEGQGIDDRHLKFHRIRQTNNKLCSIENKNELLFDLS